MEKIGSFVSSYLDTKPRSKDKIVTEKPPQNALKNTSFVVKGNALIEARYRLSLQESHVVLWLLTRIRPDDEDFKLHLLNIQEFANMVGLKADGQYTELQSITENLMRRILKISEPDTQDVLQVAWLSSAKYQKRKGCVLLRFDPGLKPYLLQLKSHFTKISIVDTLKLKSLYAVRVFELLLQYDSIGTRKMSLEDLRNYCGIDEDEYIGYGMFKCKVIEKAKTEINGKTDYLIDYKEIKESRKVVAIQWTIKKKDRDEEERQNKLSAVQKELRSQALLIQAIMEFGFSRPTAKRFITSNGEDVVKKAVRAVNRQVERGHAKNPKAMLQKAIVEKWDPEIFRNRKKIT